MVKEFRFDIELYGKSYNLSARKCNDNRGVVYIIGLPTFFCYVENSILKSVPSEQMLQMIRQPNGEYSFIPWKSEKFGVNMYAIQQEVSQFLARRDVA